MEGVLEFVIAVILLSGTVWLALRIPGDGPDEARRVLRDNLAAWNADNARRDAVPGSCDMIGAERRSS